MQVRARSRPRGPIPMLSNWFDQVIIFIFSASSETHAAGTPIRYARFLSSALFVAVCHFFYFSVSMHAKGTRTTSEFHIRRASLGLTDRKAAVWKQACERTVKTKIYSNSFSAVRQRSDEIQRSIELASQRHFACA